MLQKTTLKDKLVVSQVILASIIRLPCNEDKLIFGEREAERERTKDILITIMLK